MMPEEEHHYLPSEMERVIDKRFWLIIEVIALGFLYYIIITYKNEKLKLKQVAISFLVYGLALWYAFGSVKVIWQSIELYYNRQVVEKHEQIDTTYKKRNFHTSEGYFRDMNLYHYYRLQDAMPDTLEVEKAYHVPIRFSIGRFGWRFDPEPMLDQIRKINE